MCVCVCVCVCVRLIVSVHMLCTAAPVGVYECVCVCARARLILFVHRLCTVAPVCVCVCVCVRVLYCLYTGYAQLLLAILTYTHIRACTS